MSHETSPSRELVLGAAQQILCRHGYAGLSMRELARLSGLAKSTIYHHFADKRDIFVSVLERNIAAIRDEIAGAAATPGDFRTRLHNVIGTYFQAQTERGLVVIHVLRETQDLEVDLCSILRRYRNDLFQPVELVIQEAIDAGECRPVNVEMAVVGLYGAIHGFVSHRFLLHHGDKDEEMIDHILDLFLHGLILPSSATHHCPEPLDVASDRDAIAPQGAPAQPMAPQCTPLDQRRRANK